MTLKSRLRKIEMKVFPPEKRRRLMTKAEFEKRVERTTLGLGKFGIITSEDEVRKLTIEHVKGLMNFGGFDFDPEI